MRVKLFNTESVVRIMLQILVDIYAVHGCREFMASGEEGTSASLKCAACNCHRNFHRR
ncbi:hypothetical protein MKW94_022028 [Papaver nudicaule]|uniref:ZF-HD dimerization-type domain-containing protein n=1 Tax=Papaver nudicaule TaxID=74823 RepID=A0AA41VPS6_PAPNU|nr:hypothetical protein [Papaver nudicaule]